MGERERGKARKNEDAERKGERKRRETKEYAERDRQDRERKCIDMNREKEETKKKQERRGAFNPVENSIHNVLVGMLVHKLHKGYQLHDYMLSV